MKFFKYDNDIGDITLNDEQILTIKEFKVLLDENRNKTKNDKTGHLKERAFKEFTYLYLFIDWESPYFNIPEQERHEAALQDSNLTEEEFNDPMFKDACRKYDEIQNSAISIRLLRSAMSSVETLIYYLQHVDLNERDPLNGKPIYKTKDLIAEIKGCKDVIIGLNELELQVKKEVDQDTGLRGNAEAGYYD